MSTPTPLSGGIPPPPSRSLAQRAPDMLVWGAVIVLLVISFKPVEMSNLGRLFSNSENMRQYGAELLRPDFTNIGLYVSQMWLTVQIAMWGTGLAVLLAIPFGLVCSRNISPPWLQQPMRLLMNLLRSIPDLVIGTFFIVAVGLGPFAGVLALAINTGGVLAKLFSEAVEAIDRGPVEGVRATGAAPLQEVVWAVIPQVAPLWASYALYRFESNSRAATVLGLIGAGGIGQVLFESLNAFAYQELSTIIIVIIVAVSLIDLLSQAMRSRLI
ncbi:phosphonate ABC transporter, permease protein PhnE [Phenylobacterium sp.]|uniref:phosphonate ABC transporter, permease protein PhnE n=1 Tax=Phenylobacterium sp. TaxID=1871053 RepID=UPI0027339637|nr:phosphonate ABC transporter, permease protein PhnE [Phenylobacterium sp.]MDP3173541.1 phosphonate ABC transporter, permease protein PhnE [Phenylobacterium sp.]MDP3658525.1 phosphonate ABC transporter, permease protein PhnE [Phenylobacterium sp.]